MEEHYKNVYNRIQNTDCILSVEGKKRFAIWTTVAKPAVVKYRYRIYFVYKSV